MDAVLSKEKAFLFLEEVLKISDAKTKLTKLNKLDFLKSIVLNWYRNVPFQNIDQLCLTKRENRLQTVEEIISAHLKGRGGVCMTNAIFCYLLLSAFDYNVYLSVTTIFLPNDHFIVIAKDVVKKGDSYLIEVGCGWPCFQPIPLDELTDEVKTSRVYVDSNFEYLYVREEEFVVRYHRKNDYVNENSLNFRMENGWNRRSQTDLRVVDIDYVYSHDAAMYGTLTDLKYFNLTRQLYAIVYTNERVLVIKNCSKIYDDENDQRVTIEFESNEKLKEELAKYFPMLDSESVDEAIEFYQSNYKKYGTDVTTD